MADGSGWLEIVLGSFSEKKKTEFQYFIANASNAMDTFTEIHNDMIFSLRETNDLLSQDNRVDKLNEIQRQLDRIRDKGQSNRIRIFEEAKKTEITARTFSGKEFEYISRFSGMICEYFERDNVYRHELGYISFSVCNIIASVENNEVKSSERNRKLKSVDDQMRIMRAGIREAIDIYVEQYRSICKTYSEIKSIFISP